MWCQYPGAATGGQRPCAASNSVLLRGAEASSPPGRQGPRRASIPVLLKGASSPQRQEALPCLCDWDYGAGGWENKENCNREEKTESQLDEEERKEKDEVRIGLTLKNTPHPATGSSAATASSHPHIPAVAKPLERAEAAVWTATLALSQAGANDVFHSLSMTGHLPHLGAIKQPSVCNFQQVAKAQAVDYSLKNSSEIHR